MRIPGRGRQSAESACACAIGDCMTARAVGGHGAHWLRSVITIVTHQILQVIQDAD